MADYTCGRRTKSCRECGHRYPKAERDLWACPDCDEPRACTQPVAREGQACRFHGGKSRKGLAHPRFKDGSRSKYMPYLPQSLKEAHEAAAANSRILDLRDEIALVDARVGELLGRVSSGGIAAQWQALEGAWTNFQAAQRDARQAADREDKAAAQKASARASDALNAIGETIDRGKADYAAWEEIGDQLDRRRKLVDSQRKAMVQAQQMVTAEEARNLIAAMSGAVRQHVDDPEALVAIGEAFEALARTAAGGRPDRLTIGD